MPSRVSGIAGSCSTTSTAPLDEKTPQRPRRVRPERLQALQRLLRPSRRRCPARPPRREARPLRRRPRLGVQDGRRRVLHPVHARTRTPRPSSRAPPARSRTTAPASRSALPTGSVLFPSEASTAAEALQRSDQRMYANKQGGRTSASRAVQPGSHARAVRVPPGPRRPSRRRGTTRGSSGGRARTAAQPRSRASGSPRALHDVGKMAIPAAILEKPGPLSEHERQFLRPAHDHRSADPARGAGSVAALRRRALEPRAHRREGLPRRPRGKRDPARRPASSSSATHSTP